MSELIRARLQAAGLPIALPAGDFSDCPTLLSLFGVRALLQPVATRPARIELDSDRLGPLLRGAGVYAAPPVTDKTVGLIVSLPLPRGTTALNVLEAAMGMDSSDEQEIMAIARGLGGDALRPLFMDACGRDGNSVKAEGLVGLAKWGKPEDASAVIPLLKHDEEHVCVHALFALYSMGVLEDVFSNADPDQLIDGDNSEIMASLVEFTTSGDVDAFAEHMDNGDWETRVALYRLARAVAEKEPSAELAEALIRHGDDESDSDAAVSWSWSLGAAAVPDAGIGEQTLDMAENLSEGSYAHCSAIAAVGRMNLSADEKAEAIERLAGYSISDGDANAAIRTAIIRLDPSAAGRAPSYDEYVAKPGYNKLEDFWYGSSAGSPVVEAFLDQKGDVAGSLLAYLAKNEAPMSIMGLAAAVLVKHAPLAIPVLDEITIDVSKPSDTRRAGAAALLTYAGAVRCSPGLLRCILGHDAGGPLADTGIAFGELLALLDDSDAAESARNLLAMFNADFREVAASFFDARFGMEKIDADEYSKVRARLGVQMRPMPTGGRPDALLRMAAGLKVSTGQLIGALSVDPPRAKQVISDYLASSRDRHAQISMAKDSRVQSAFSDAEFADLWLRMANRDHWMPREASANMIQSATQRLTNGPRSEEILERIQEMCDDSDSDVSRISTEVCESLGIA